MLEGKSNILARMRHLVWASLGLLMTGCVLDTYPIDTEVTPEGGAVESPVIATSNEDIPPPDEEGCHGLYAQNILPMFELELAPEVLSALYEDWFRGAERDALDYDDAPYHPVAEFRYGDIVITDAVIRLRGNPTYWLDQIKMQFQIAFDKVDPDGRFLGLRKILLDAASHNRHFLRDRLALWIMRRAGITAPCANNARLMINGEYYGLFTSLEKLDDLFLQRTYPGNDTGALWKRTRWQGEHNITPEAQERLDDLLDVDSLSELEDLLDIEQAIRVWATDAIIPNSDGPWAGGFNFYMYDDPQRGKFVVLPWDLDQTFERLDPDVDPYSYKKPERFRGRPFYDMSLRDAHWFQRYVETIAEVREQAYEPGLLNQKITEWTDQIRTAALEDRNKPFADTKYEENIEELREFIEERYEFLGEWGACWENGGTRDARGHCVSQVR